ncbi:hypothetical protein PGB90_010230 [Kerria lacca]
MLPCASLSTLLFTFTCRNVFAILENDTSVVGFFVHETKIKPSVDLLTSASKKNQDDSFGVELGNEGFKKSHSSKDKDGYNKFDTYHTKDGDGFGYEQHFEFGKKGGDHKNGGYHESSSYNDDDGGDSVNPKFSEWHFEEKSGSPAKSYRYESDSSDNSKGKLVGPDYEESSETQESKSTRPKRKKDPQVTAATEYDNYEYADVEEPDDGAPADFEAEEGEPEYGALYADVDAYDYY